MTLGYRQRVDRIGYLARKYWFDMLVVLLAIVAMLEVALGRGSRGAPRTTLWFCVPAIAILVLPIFARHRFPFAGPAMYWLLAAGISFVDPRLIPFSSGLFLLGMAVAFLLGNLRDARRAGVGLAVIVGSVVTIVLNIPRPSATAIRAAASRSRSAWAARNSAT